MGISCLESRWPRACCPPSRLREKTRTGAPVLHHIRPRSAPTAACRPAVPPRAPLLALAHLPVAGSPAVPVACWGGRVPAAAAAAAADLPAALAGASSLVLALLALDVSVAVCVPCSVGVVSAAVATGGATSRGVPLEEASPASATERLPVELSLPRVEVMSRRPPLWQTRNMGLTIRGQRLRCAIGSHSTQG